MVLDPKPRYTYHLRMPTEPDALLPITEAAQILGLSVDTLRRYDRNGTLRAVRTPGGHRRFRRSDVEALLAPSEPKAKAS